jgi:hypothetical protein
VDDLNKIGIIAGVLMWLALILFSSRQVECPCNADDLFLSSIIGVGLVVPSVVFGLIVSIFTKK